ncbi:MAG: exonuclease SbcCD subunit D [Chloroflexi bacterium]|nr:exonuclease SbcCD subunit D [Chloroflexota bacterium]
MRILHFSDVHIGVENYGRVDPNTGLSSRLTDFLQTYDEVVEYALANEVDLVLFCGDAYKSRDPSQTHQRAFAQRIARLSAAGIPVFLLVGNHDLPHTSGKASALDIFPTLSVPNIYIGERLDTYLVSTKSGALQIVALPWIRRGSFLAREDMRGLSPEQVNERIQESLTNHLRWQAEGLDPQTPSILAGHVSIGEAKTSSEQSMMLGKDHVLLHSSVALPYFDYVALGHIHKHQALGRNPMVVYSGSLQAIDFGEENDTKGFCVIELDPALPAGRRLTDFQFHPVQARRFLTVTVDIQTTDDDPTEKVVKAILRHHIQGAIVRVNVRIPSELEGHLDEAQIRRALEQAHYLASVSKEVLRGRRTRLGSLQSQTLNPQEALRLYLTSKNTPAERIKTLMLNAESLMQEEP